MNNTRIYFATIIISVLCTLIPSLASASFDVNLSYGASGSAVLSLQQFLVAQDYPGGGSWMETGYFGNATASAVREFQMQEGITPASGFFGPITRARANEIANSDGSPPVSSLDNTVTYSDTADTSNGESSIAALIASLQTQVQQLEAQIASIDAANNTQTSDNQNQSCTFNNETIASGSSVIAYQSASVSSGQSCESETRACSNGMLSGSFMYGSCTPQQSAYVCPVYMLPACVNGTLVPQGTDSEGCQLPQLCVPNTLIVAPTSGGAPLTVSFSIPLKSYQTGTLTFGDGTAAPVSNPFAITCPASSQTPCTVTKTVSHTYAAAGTYTATFGTQSATITVD